MVVIQIRRKQSLEVAPVQDNDVLEKLSAKAVDQSLHIGVLPRRCRHRYDLVDAQTQDSSLNPIAVNAIAVSNQITRNNIERRCLDEHIRLISRRNSGAIWGRSPRSVRLSRRQ